MMKYGEKYEICHVEREPFTTRRNERIDASVQVYRAVREDTNQAIAITEIPRCIDLKTYG